MKRYDLMHRSTRAAPSWSPRPAFPHLKKAANPHILMLSPPLDMEREVVRAPRRLHHGQVRHEHVRAGHGGGVQGDGIAVNALWPRTGIATAAMRNLLGGDELHAPLPHAGDHGRRRARDPRPGPRETFTGNFLHRRQLLYGEGVRDFDKYRVDPSLELMPDFSCRIDSAAARGDDCRADALRRLSSGIARSAISGTQEPRAPH